MTQIQFKTHVLLQYTNKSTFQTRVGMSTSNSGDGLCREYIKYREIFDRMIVAGTYEMWHI